MSKFERLAASIGANAEESTRGLPRPSLSVGGNAAALPPHLAGRERAKDSWLIDVDRIIPDPDQPRKEIDPDALERLAESLKTRGQLQPIQVRWSEAAERYVVIMGERRWRAAQVAGLAQLSCVVRSGELDDDERLSIQLVENCLREDLTAIDQAKAFRRLIDAKGWSYERLAAELSITQASVSRSLSLLTLPDVVQEDVTQGRVSQSAAYEIAKLDDPREQIRIAQTVADQGLTARDVAKQVRKSPSKKKAPAAKKLPPARIWRVDGLRVEVSRKSGVDPAAALAALENVASQLRSELAEAQAEAA